MTNEVPKFEDMPLPIRTHENYNKILKAWLEAWKKETDSKCEALEERVGWWMAKWKLKSDLLDESKKQVLDYKNTLFRAKLVLERESPDSVVIKEIEALKK